MKKVRYSLQQVYPETPSGLEVDTEFELQGEELIARYRVKNPPMHVNEELSEVEPQWGLWEWDVVELFIALGRNEAGEPLPYFEFQLSPLNQYLELKILQPRKEIDRSVRTGVSRKVIRADSEEWLSELRVPLRRLGWNGDPLNLIGNAFAILGSGEGKSFWSAFLPKQRQPDFHLPEFFRPIFGHEED